MNHTVTITDDQQELLVLSLALKSEFGPCCCCGGGKRVRNIVMLSQRAPVPGTGWGCVQCGLPNDGASYVCCDQCLEDSREPTHACKGYLSKGERIPVEDLDPTPFEHDMSRHPGER